jgi:hypothetical protein
MSTHVYPRETSAEKEGQQCKRYKMGLVTCDSQWQTNQ